MADTLRKIQNTKLDNFNEIITKTPISLLIKIANRICSTDYKIIPFKNIFNNSEYFDENNIKELINNNRKYLETSIRKAYQTGAFEHRKQTNDILDDFLDILKRLNENELNNYLNVEFENFVKDVKNELIELKEKLQGQIIDDNVEIIDFNIHFNCVDIRAFDHNDGKYYKYIYEDEEILIKEEKCE